MHVCDWPDGSTPLHPRLFVPAPPPPGWDQLAPLISLRIWLGVSQAEVAHAWPGGGCTRAYVSALERGRSGLRVTPDAAERYRAALAVLAMGLGAANDDLHICAAA